MRHIQECSRVGNSSIPPTGHHSHKYKELVITPISIRNIQGRNRDVTFGLGAILFLKKTYRMFKQITEARFQTDKKCPRFVFAYKLYSIN